jgi:predicted alpha/beta-fold hydrolase
LKNGKGHKLDPNFDFDQLGLKQSSYDDVQVLLYTQQNPNSAQRLYIGNDQALQDSNYIAGAPLIVTSHGFGGDAHGGSGKALREMYIASGRNFNVIAIDWGKYAESPWYDTAAANCRGVGQFVGRFLEWLLSKGVTSLEKIHFTGHSLGAHVAGFCGDELKKRVGPG